MNTWHSELSNQSKCTDFKNCACMVHLWSNNRLFVAFK